MKPHKCHSERSEESQPLARPRFFIRLISRCLTASGYTGFRMTCGMSFRACLPSGLSFAALSEEGSLVRRRDPESSASYHLNDTYTITLLRIFFLTELNMETPKQVVCGLASIIAAAVCSYVITCGLAYLWPAFVADKFVIIFFGSFLVLWWIFFLALAISKKGR